MTIAMFCAATVIVTVAAALQAATGMGMALVAAPLLALLDIRFVPVPTLLAVMFLSALVSWRGRREIDRSIVPAALSGLLVGCCGGAGLLAAFEGARPNRVFALLILGSVILSLTGIRVPVNRLSLSVGGAASGILGTMSGAHGPPIALVLQHEPPEQLRATLCAFFTFGCAVSLLMLGVAGLLNRAGIEAGVELLPGVVAGLLIGRSLGRKVDRRRTRWAVLGMSALSALVLLFR